MSYKNNARLGRRYKAMFWGGAVTAILGFAAAVVAYGSNEPGSGDAMSPDHAVEHPAEHTLSTTDQNVNEGLDSITGEADPHAHHRHMMETKSYSRSLHRYDLPDLAMVDMDGGKTSLLSEVNRDQPVMLNFIFTTCTTICPVLSATFSQVELELGDESDQVRMISITIDPEYDTPARLRDYAERYHAGSQWQFLTGNLQDIVAVQKAFDVYRGTKMSHEPFTFLRVSAYAPWVRLKGLASAADVVREYRQLVAEQDQAP
jgi:protein SCO1/2